MKKFSAIICFVFVVLLLTSFSMPIYASGVCIDPNDISDTDLFYGYPMHMQLPAQEANLEIVQLYGATLQECTAGAVIAATWETSMESFGNITATTKLALDFLGITNFNEQEAADAAALAILKAYYSDEMQGAIANEKMASTYEKYVGIYNKAMKTAQDLEKVKPDDVSDENWFWTCFEEIRAAIKYETGCDIGVPTDQRDALYKYFRKGASCFKEVLDMTGVLMKWFVVGEIETTLIDYILENEYVSGELRNAFVRLKKDLGTNWIAYVLKYYGGNKLFDKMCEEVFEFCIGKFTSQLKVITVGVNLAQWVLLDVFIDNPNVKDWTTYAYVGNFYFALSNTMSDKLTYILENPVSSKEIDDFEYFYGLYAASLIALFDKAEDIGHGIKDEVSHNYIFSYADYLFECKERMSIDVGNWIIRQPDDTKSYSISGSVYISDTKPDVECDYWIKPFNGVVFYKLVLMRDARLKIVADCAIPDLYWSYQATVDLFSCKVVINNSLKMNGQLHINDGVLEVEGDVSAESEVAEFFCDTGKAVIQGKVYGRYWGLNPGYMPIYISSGSMIIKGNFESASLIMDRPGGYLLIEGNKSNSYGQAILTGGALEARGDLYLPTDAVIGGSHRTILSGASAQRITGKYNELQLLNPLANISSYVVVNSFVGNIKSENPIYISNCSFLKSEELTAPEIHLKDCTYDDDITLTMNGDFYPDGEAILGKNSTTNICGNLVVVGDLQINDGTVNVAGNIAAKGQFAHIQCNTGTIVVNGGINGYYYAGVANTRYLKISVQSGKLHVKCDVQSIHLYMENEEGFLVVGGNYSGFYGYKKLLAGTIEANGNCQVPPTQEVGGTHRTIISGTAAQKVSGKYNILILKNPQITLDSNVTGTIYDLSGKSITTDDVAVFANNSETAIDNLSVSRIYEGVAFESIAARAKQTEFNMCHVSGETTAPIVIQMELPNGANGENAAVYRINGDFITKMDVDYDGIQNLLWKTDKTGTYVIVANSIVTYGDTNGDEKLSLTDILRVLKKVSGTEVALDIAAADINGDETISIIDVLMILRSVLNQ